MANYTQVEPRLAMQDIQTTDTGSKSQAWHNYKGRAYPLVDILWYGRVYLFKRRCEHGCRIDGRLRPAPRHNNFITSYRRYWSRCRSDVLPM